MNHKPIVTIVIPTYNHAEFLQKALVSVLQQTFTDWEAIIVNNYSDDNTEAVVKSFNEPRFHLENFHNNGIIAASRNHAIKHAKGDYIAFLDSDDEWLPKKIEECLKVLNKASSAVVCHAERWLLSSGHEQDVQYGPAAKATYNSLLYNGNTISTSAVVVSAKVLHEVGLFSEEHDIVTAEDYDLWLRIVNSSEYFTFIPEVLGNYRVHPKGNSQAVKKNINAILNVIENHFLLVKNKTFFDYICCRRAFGKVLCSGGIEFQKKKNRSEAFKMFFHSWKTFPFSFRLYLAFIINLMPFTFYALIYK
jgi:teichuronic acid biosynthesis glycosyltransferase TuaG